MENFGITLADLVVISIIIVVAFMGLAFGLVKAILFFGSWIGAGIITLYLYEYIQPIFKEYLEKQLYSDIAAVSSVYLISLILLFWCSSLVWRAVRKSEFSGLDRSLGFFGGIIVGSFLLCIVYLGVTWVWIEEELPTTISKARARPYLQIGTEFIQRFFPGRTVKDVKTTVGKTQRRIEDAIETERAMRRLLGQVTGKAETNKPLSKQRGYEGQSRRDMDRLIENKQ